MRLLAQQNEVIYRYRSMTQTHWVGIHGDRVMYSIPPPHNHVYQVYQEHIA